MHLHEVKKYFLEDKIYKNVQSISQLTICVYGNPQCIWKAVFSLSRYLENQCNKICTVLSELEPKMSPIVVFS